MPSRTVWQKLTEWEIRIAKHWEIWVIVSVLLLISFPWGNDFTCKSCTIFVLNNGLHHSLNFQTYNNVWIPCTGREFSFSLTPLIFQKQESSKLLQCVCVCLYLVCVYVRKRDTWRCPSCENFLIINVGFSASSLYGFPLCIPHRLKNLLRIQTGIALYRSKF